MKKIDCKKCIGYRNCGDPALNFNGDCPSYHNRKLFKQKQHLKKYSTTYLIALLLLATIVYVAMGRYYGFKI